MRQYDVCRNTDRTTSGRIPYFIVLQSDLLDGLLTTVVAPLYLSGQRTPISKLNPEMHIEGRACFASIQELAGVTREQLGPVVSNHSNEHVKFIAGIDLLFTGF
jgi:hypothetical protein